MSEEEQTNGDDQGQPDDSEPSLERQAKLEQAYEANVTAGDPPYKDVWIQTRGELRWVMEKRKWSSEIDIPKGHERANLTNANLSEANLGGMGLRWANLTSADLSAANLTNANLSAANLTGADLRWANLTSADLSRADLTGTDLMDAKLTSASLRWANLTSAELSAGNLSGMDLRWANLSGANLRWANLSSADLRWANLSGADLMDAKLTGASLSGSRMDVATSFTEVTLNTTTRLADVIWNNTPLTRIAWEELSRLGDETVARHRKDEDSKRKDSLTRLDEYQAAARSYRQLAVALRDQGLSEDADRYAYRGQLMQRIVLRRQAFLRRKGRRVGLFHRLRYLIAYLGSGLLDLIAGYGYRPGRSVATYVITILAFAFLYWCVTNDVSLTHGWFSYAITLLGMKPPAATPDHLQGYEAVVVSMTSFHGRGFFQPIQSPGDKVAILAAIEAAIGLLIEIVFIATFTQRFFGK